MIIPAQQSQGHVADSFASTAAVDAGLPARSQTACSARIQWLQATSSFHRKWTARSRAAASIIAAVQSLYPVKALNLT
jgi:hypothetical protein